MEPEDKVNEDLVAFMRKRSETGAPQYTARIKTYLNIKQKQRRAAAARHHAHKFKEETKPTEDSERHRAEDKVLQKRKDKAAPQSRSQCGEPADACRPRRKQRRRRASRRSGCGCRRRRKRSCSRRRRRRSVRRRRRRRRRGCR